MSASEVRDITGSIGPLYGRNVGDGSIPMYSYERPAYVLWQSIFAGLLAAGHSEEQAIEWLQSKSARWALDGSLGDEIRALGYKFGKEQKL